MKTAYKLFRYKNGNLYPLYVYANEHTPVGKWIPAKFGPLTDRGKVKSKLGELCFRPGWHLSELPLATHIGVKRDGKIVGMHPDTVWCECEYNDEIDYTAIVNANGTKNGRFNPRDAYMKDIPIAGYYYYKTSPNMFGNWIIAGEIKVNKVLSDEEVEKICKDAGYEAQRRLA